MEHKAVVLKLLVLFLGFCFVLSAAVPTSRSLKSFKDDQSVQDLLAQGDMDLRNDGELPEVLVEGRMMESYTDYGPTGANKNHDPKTPGQP